MNSIARNGSRVIVVYCLIVVTSHIAGIYVELRDVRSAAESMQQQGSCTGNQLSPPVPEKGTLRPSRSDV
jgi:hypothetical protein